ncbi:MAG: glycosyltransferase family 2 protein [Acidobacteriaceae bacterium]|nr:glycosyltransferase family 2 protein [Acidobacteriaceae bacterium]
MDTERTESTSPACPPRLSIVIPAYNEAQRIEDTLERVVLAVAQRQWDAEVLVVDDGSTDETIDIIHRWMDRYQYIKLVQNPGNRGKGFSVRNGLLQAAGEIVMFTDADLSAPIEEAERLFKALEAGADVAIGSRWLDKQRQIVHQPLYRRFFGRCFNYVTRKFIGLPYKDTQCGFKAFKHDAAQVIFRLQTIERWGFDPEILFIARRLRFKIVEVPVTWGHDERSRISYLKDGMKMLEEMAQIRTNSVRGRYDEAIAEFKNTAAMVTPQVTRRSGTLEQSSQRPEVSH